MEADRTIAAFTALMGGTGILTGVLQDFESTSSFVEIQSRSHKTAKSAANKVVLLPVVVPAIRITGQLWVQHAIDAFNKVGLQYTGEWEGPLYHPPLRDGLGNCNLFVPQPEGHHPVLDGESISGCC